ncbi:hypothetical protein V497_03124 [Pseudogymnoascus sp. VKM F-4516 (FW-969)]|nr:hypothetical protein V497_03124 [Pseudogymnoascus sp. VKM F-4516 (FW-969)]
MPISKKARVQREHKKADAAGTRVPVKANGLPVKPPKATAIVCSSFSFSSSITFFPPATPPSHVPGAWLASGCGCANCRKEIVSSNKTQLQVHAETHDQKLWPKEKCWPNEFPAVAA